MIGITFALPAESSEFVGLLQNRSVNSRDGVESIRGRIHGKSVAVLHTGVGEKVCRPQIETFLRRQEFEYLISAGFAGALEEELQVGHLLIAENFASPALLGSPQLDFAEETLFLGKLVTARRVTDSKRDREWLAKDSGAAAVDMETECIAAACAARNVPMLSLRVISDTPAQPLPAPSKVLFDLEKQKTNYLRLAAYVATHPSAFTRLNSFRQQIGIARNSLTNALEKILRAKL
ncbi:MAG: adenosylhomocysteine nucleosidase [Verrucomicrobiota bacterium]|jgi:nucleoside phosphorylase